MTAIDLPHFNAGVLLLLFFSFDPGWIKPRLQGLETGHTLIFYDGACGLCHRTIRLLLAEDPAGLRFRFAPLDSDAFLSACGAPESGFGSDDVIPDSVLVQRPGEPMLSRGDGMLEIGQQLGGLWRLLAVVAGWVPRTILNAGYDFVARVRHRLFTRPDDACPILPPHLRDRFRL
jgi:predicted DCC family thiol-disulfide oxidoreductase YuxK